MPTNPLAGLRSRAFNSPADDYLRGGFRTSSGTPYRTAYQDLLDDQEQNRIDTNYRRGLDTIAARERAMGDPMQKAVEARKTALDYERLQPAGAESYVKFGMGDTAPWEYGGDESATKQAGQRTVGETYDVLDAYEKARARSVGGVEPKERMEMDTYGYRQEALQELQRLKAGLEAGVRAGQFTEEDAKNRYRAALQKLAEEGALQEGDYGSVGRLLNPPTSSILGAE